MQVDPLHTLSTWDKKTRPVPIFCTKVKKTNRRESLILIATSKFNSKGVRGMAEGGLEGEKRCPFAIHHSRWHLISNCESEGNLECIGGACLSWQHLGTCLHMLLAARGLQQACRRLFWFEIVPLEVEGRGEKEKRPKNDPRKPLPFSPFYRNTLLFLEPVSPFLIGI